MKDKSLLAKFFSMKETGILLGLIGLCAVLSLTTDSFLNRYNLTIVVRQASFAGIAALGQTLVLLTGGSDLSIGFNAGLAGILTTLLMTRAEMPPAAAVPGGLIVGALFGAATDCSSPRSN